MLKFYLIAGSILATTWLAFAEPLALPSVAWLNQSKDALTVSEENNLLTLKAEAPTKNDYAVSKSLNKFPKEPLILVGTINCAKPRAAYLQVKLYQNRKETNRISSSRCKGSNQPEELFVEFDPSNADRIEILCRIAGGEKQVGCSVQFSGLKILTKVEFAKQQKQIKLIPGYEVCSIELPFREASTYDEFKSELSFCEAGSSQWHQALPLAYDPKEKCARGSLLNLKENTSYQIRLSIEDKSDKEEFETTFRTLSSQVPIAKTIELGADTKLPLLIKESGTPKGYIRYTAKPGTVLNGGENADNVIEIENVQFIILDGLTIRGGRINGIRMENASNIQILNCDIAGFSRVGVQRPDLDGKFYENERILNNDAGIRIMKSQSILVERCYIHDPRGTSNPWFYSHPAGPNAIFVGSAEQATFRYNDFIGSDLHRWNDAVEGWGNGSEYGSVCRDAEIIGNYFALGDDDGMELDGGQRNCRFLYNKAEGFLCGISTAPSLVGPTYLVGNLFCQPGDEFGSTNTAIKNNFPRTGGRGKVYILHNTMVGKWGTISGYCNSNDEDDLLKTIFKGYSRNNVSSVTGGMSVDKIFVAQNDFDYDLWHTGKPELIKTLQTEHHQESHAITGKPIFTDASHGIYTLANNSPGVKAGEPIPNISDENGAPNVGILHADLPFRPVPFHADVAMLEFPSASATPINVTVTVDDPNFKSEFKIVRNDSSSFIKVVPDSGTLAYGKPVVLSVSVDPAGVTSARLNAGVFLIRLPNGMSRPVSVYADTTADTTLVAKDRTNVIYGTIESSSDHEASVSIDIPKEGGYYLFLRSAQRGKISSLSIDGTENKNAVQRGGNVSQTKWRPVSLAASSPNQPCKLSAGKHTIKLQGLPAKIEGLALSEKPDAMILAPLQP